MLAASNRRALSGISQPSKNGCNVYCANVSDIIAFDVGLMITNAAQRNKNAGSGPKAYKNKVLLNNTRKKA